jgi:uncharacterized ubiquitin-like protein YukD
MDGKNIKREINEIIRAIRDEKSLYTDIETSNEQIDNLEIRINELCDLCNYKYDRIYIKYSSLEDIKKEINNLINTKKSKLTDKNIKYFDKLSGFATKKACFLWDNEKITDFYNSLMK